MNKIIIFFLFLNVCHAGPIPIIGHTRNSTYIYSEMMPEDYIEILKITKSALDEKVVQSLNAEASKNWKLNKISIGLGVTGEVGIGPYKFGKSLKQRFVFTR